jgi:hypothetical protein
LLLFFSIKTYFGIDVDAIEDPMHRNAIKTMVKTYGQTPKQLFKAPHPLPGPWARSQDRARVGRAVEPMASVVGLRWGHFLGSPDDPDPVCELIMNHGAPVMSLIALPTGEVFGLGPNFCLMVMYSKEKGIGEVILYWMYLIDDCPVFFPLGLLSMHSMDVLWAAIVSWGHPDGVLRVRNKRDLPAVNFLHWKSPDDVTCCASVPDCRLLFFGGSSGAITVVHMKYNAHKVCHLRYLHSSFKYKNGLLLTTLKLSFFRERIF